MGVKRDGYNMVFECDTCKKSKSKIIDLTSVKAPSPPWGWILEGNRIYCSKKCKNNAPQGNCFITTATVKSRNLPDDCHELTSLRNFRDTFMKKDELMKEEVEEYYRIAPTICENIDKLSNSSEIYDEIYQKWIIDSVFACDSGDKQKAHDIYKEMVLELKERYL